MAKNNNINLILVVIVALVVGAGSFYGGMKYQESRRPAFMRQPGQRGNGQFQGAARNGFRPVAGEIISADDKSITVKLMDGSSKIVLVTDKTQINKAGEAKKEDLKTGENVAVFGMENADGSVTAQTVQLNPLSHGGTPGGR